VDRYRSGYKTYILISRHEVKNKGDVDGFNVEWDIRQGFLRRTEQWETHVTHRTRCLKINVIFPRSRPPRSIPLVCTKTMSSSGNGERGIPFTPTEKATVPRICHLPGLQFHFRCT
jgi:hypothetical protein